MKLSIIHRSVITGLLLFCSTLLRVSAATEPYQHTLQGKIKKGDTLIVKDEKFRNSSYEWSRIRNKTVDNIITFGFYRDTAALPQKAFKCKLDLKVEYWSQPDQVDPVTEDHVILEIGYDPAKGAIYQAEKAHYFKNGHRVKITVNDITSAELGDELPPAFKLTNKIFIDRQYDRDPNVTETNSPFIIPTPAKTTNNGALRSVAFDDPVESGGKVLVGWLVDEPSEHYDLDWTFIDEESNFGKQLVLEQPATHAMFRNNFTRVTIDANHYPITLVHQAKFLLVRVRGVSMENGIRKECGWGDILVYSLDNSWHQTEKNWQYNATYAEEGKKKEIISYADGSLRNRQSVTVANAGTSSSEDADKYVVVQEMIYDEFGRPAMKILPAPLKEKEIKYYPSLHLNEDLLPYNFANMYGTSSTSPDKPDQLFGNGASTYYSPNNPFLNDDIAGIKFVPDAKKYPFSVTRYTPDNTGRVKIQGGVGETFQPGEDGKTNMFFYGKPEAWELDRLFGNDVGFAHHYLKKMSVDPNGQVSISYENASGKVIATALTGAAPANLKPLASQPVVASKTTPLLIPSQFRFDPSRLTLTATANYMVSLPNQSFQVDYSVEQLMAKYQIQNNGQPEGEICSNCYYSIKITVSDDDGNIETVITQPSFAGSKFSDCDLDQPKVESFTYIPRKIGTYYIRFELGMSEDVIAEFTDDYIKRNTDLRSEFDAVVWQVGNTELLNCLQDCKTAMATLGERPEFINRLKQQLALNQIDADEDVEQFENLANYMYDRMYEHCQNISQYCFPSPCDEYKNIMLADVSPGGQYALFTSDHTPLEPTINVIALHWRTVFPIREKEHPDYKAVLIELENGKLISPHDVDFTLAQLLQYWDPAWAQEFLKYHPEKCALDYCERNAEYIRWDNKVKESIQTAAQIPLLKEGLEYLHNQADWLIAADPFFQGGPGEPMQLDYFRARLLYYSQKIAGDQLYPRKGLTEFVDYTLYCADPFGNTNTDIDVNTWANCTPAENCRVPDREWQLYRNLYFDLKEEIYQIIRDGECLNQCKPGKPVSAASACPSPGMFSFYKYSTSSGGIQNVKVKYDGVMQWYQFRLHLKFPPGYETVPTSIELNPRGFSWALDEDLNLNEIIITSVECIPLPAATVPCNGDGGELDLSATDGKRTGEFTFTDEVSGSTVTYHIEKGYSDEQPVLTDYCEGATADYYNCFKVTIGDAVYPFYNVWLITCGNVAGRAMPMAMKSASIMAGACYTESDFQLQNTAALPNQFRSEITFIGAPIPADVKVTVQVSITFDLSTAQDIIEFTSADNNGTPKYGDLHTGVSSIDHFVLATMNVTCEPIEPPEPECDPLYQHKIPRFGEIDFSATPSVDIDQLTTEALAGLQDQIYNNCEGNAESWVKKMEDCLLANTTPQNYAAKRVALKNGFIAVCALGGDPDHMYGASVAPPGRSTQTGGYTSFGDVIKQVLNVSVYNMSCNPWLIEGPYPYKTKVQGATLSIGNTSEAICEKLELLTEEHTNNAGSESFYEFIKSKFGDAANLTEDDLNVLIKGCTNCRYLLDRTIDLPVFLEPGTKGCITALEYTTAKSAFNTALGGSPNVEHEDYNSMLATYLNHQWGFTMGHDQYRDYEELLLTEPEAALCNIPAFGTTVKDDPLACIMRTVNDHIEQGKLIYLKETQEARRLFRQEYLTICGRTKAQATLIAPQQIYHYTLYYYNQAGQLIRTVPPEGVMPLSDEDVLKVQEARANEWQECNYDGPDEESEKEWIASDLDYVMNNGPAALEYWLQNDGSAPLQVAHASSGEHNYMFNTCINGNYLNVDIYELMPSNMAILINHTAVNIQNALPLREFIHVVIQGDNFVREDLEVYVNGVACPVAPEAPAASCELEQDPGGVYQEKYDAIRHVRMYYALLSASDITKLVANTCMTFDYEEGEPGYNRFTWHVLNIPDGGLEEGTLPSGIVFKGKYPDHKMATSYAYNTLGQVVQQKTPDAGISKFWHDYLGRLILSQNAEQLDPAQENAEVNRYSYTKYERLGRIEEVGEVLGISEIPSTPFLTETEYGDLMGGTTRQQITRTYYDVRPMEITETLDNLRKRVAASMYWENDGGDPEQLTYYSYDQLGNVKSLWQKIKDLPVKQMDYNYDLASGKVNKVRYQLAGSNDRFIYGYVYDAENRLVKVENGSGFTGNDNWDIEDAKTQAVYKYYPHGWLSRIELGEHAIQGIDYAYTIRGWLKGMNGNYLDPSLDMGMDGSDDPGGRATFAADAMAYSLNYFDEDYSAISTPSPFSLKYAPGAPYDGNQLFNGNIAGTTLALSKLGEGATVGYTYAYDQLNRLKHMRQQDVSGSWTPRPNPDASPFMENVTYDGNGNILTYERNGSGFNGKPLGMDNLSYTYETVAGEKTNRLANVVDGIPGSTDYENDLQGTKNYSYDKIGNLIAETATGTDKIFWTVYGKVSKVVKSDGSSLEYRYDVEGNRVSKTYIRPGHNTVTTWYVRDAQGNTLATYQQEEEGVVIWKEQHLYGSSRLGLWQPNMNVTDEDTHDKWLCEGNKRYELTNHLGNVIAVLSDKKLGSGDYKPEVISMQDYYPFGMPMEGRYGTIGDDGNGNPVISGLASGYRYGFNGKENDNEVKGEGNQQDYGFRVYDPRLGRFLSEDPLKKDFPWYTPYQFAGNKPIWAKDLDGLEERYFQIDISFSHTGAILSKKITEDETKRSGWKLGEKFGGYGFVRDNPVGQFGIGNQYQINIERETSKGVWTHTTITLFVARKKSWYEFGHKEPTRGGGIVFTSSKDGFGQDNKYNASAEHPDAYLVSIDDLFDLAGSVSSIGSKAELITGGPADGIKTLLENLRYGFDALGNTKTDDQITDFLKEQREALNRRTTAVTYCKACKYNFIPLKDKMFDAVKEKATDTVEDHSRIPVPEDEK
ncbi:hypothetical protein GFS24_06460 [Chitinophaga sp. SYP-B3965]|uniref:RHS repeat-associated core domain-containing protein n=1 Tax=Chitinophaga sp. SYP-B3965 TaxID=2663120 RepID=UPI00129A08DD|nr:RHS repeat-associated core domain-containing protein [Chitinophaga sp. SYP-B3965]MRG44747.1 hypothetical protein [Chitinophaga sp. SYP-B3965]